MKETNRHSLTREPEVVQEAIKMRDIDIKIICEWTSELHKKLTEEIPLNQDDINESIKTVKEELLKLNKKNPKESGE